MATITAAMADFLKEKIEDGIRDTLPKIDPFAANIFPESGGVVQDAFGRGWKTRQTYEGAICGAIEFRAPLGVDAADVTLSGTHATGLFTIYAGGAGWPSIAEAGGPATMYREITLAEARGTYPIPLQVLMADAINDTVGKQMGSILRGVSKRIALCQAHTLWKLDTKNSIGAITGKGAVVSTTPISFALTAGRVRSFYRGQYLHIYSSSGGEPDAVQDNSTTVIVTNVSYKANTIWIRTVTGSTSSLSAATTYHLLPRSSVAGSTVSYSAEGLADWHKGGATDTMFGGTIDLALYSEFASIVDTTYTGALTSDVLNAVIGQFTEAYGLELDTIVTSVGTLLGFIQNIESTSQLVRYDVQSEALMVKAGFMPMGYVFNGKTYRIMTSPCCPRGKVFVLKLGESNYKKYIPPKFGGSTKGEFGGEVVFVGKVMGSTSEIMPTYSSSELRDKMHAPFIARWQYAPTMIQAIKLGTFAENIGTT